MSVATPGRTGPAARAFSPKIMHGTNLYVALLDGKVLTRLQGSLAYIVEIIEAQARGAMTIKKGQVIL